MASPRTSLIRSNSLNQVKVSQKKPIQAPKSLLVRVLKKNYRQRIIEERDKISRELDGEYDDDDNIKVTMNTPKNHQKSTNSKIEPKIPAFGVLSTTSKTNFVLKKPTLMPTTPMKQKVVITRPAFGFSGRCLFTKEPTNPTNDANNAKIFTKNNYQQSSSMSAQLHENKLKLKEKCDYVRQLEDELEEIKAKRQKLEEENYNKIRSNFGKSRLHAMISCRKSN